MEAEQGSVIHSLELTDAKYGAALSLVSSLSAGRIRGLSIADRQLVDTQLQDAVPILQSSLSEDQNYKQTLRAINSLILRSKNIDFPEGRRFVSTFVGRSINSLSDIAKQDPRKANLALRVVARCVPDIEDVSQKKAAIDFLVENLSKWFSGVKSDHPSIYEFKNTVLNTIFTKGDDDQIKAAFTFCEHLFQQKRHGAAGDIIWKGLLAQGYWPNRTTNPYLNRLTSDAIRNVLGTNYEKIKESWMNYGQSEHNRDFFGRNLDSIVGLEKLRPGICKTLNQEFGIIFFGRYPVDVLIAQYDERNNTSMPYGAVIFPHSDWNGSFYREGATLGNLAEQLKGKYNIRVTECDSRLQLLKTLLRLDRRYGQNQKIAFAILGGHGTRYNIQLGERGNYYDINMRGIGSTRLKDMVSQLFKPHPTVILFSCSTGYWGGIGKAISEMGAKVIAPKSITSTNRVDVTIDEGGELNFEVEYWGKDAAMTFPKE